MSLLLATALLISVGQQTSQPDFKTVISQLSNYGYVVKVHRSGLSGTIRKGSDFSYTQTWSRRGGSGYESTLVFARRYHLDHIISSSDLETWRSAQPGTTQYELRIGGDIIAWTEFKITAEMPAADIAAKVDDYWNELGRFQSTFLSAGRWSELQPITLSGLLPDPNEVVKELDQEDIAFLVHQWMWEAHHGWGGSTGFWFYHADIDSMHFWFRNPPVKEAWQELFHRPLDGLVVYAEFTAPQGTDIDSWGKDEVQKLDWTGFTDPKIVKAPRDGQATVQATFLFGDGMSVQQIHDHIQHFADVAKPLLLNHQPGYAK